MQERREPRPREFIKPTVLIAWDGDRPLGPNWPHGPFDPSRAWNWRQWDDERRIPLQEWVEANAEAASYETYRRRKHPWNDPNDALETAVRVAPSVKSQLDGAAKRKPSQTSQQNQRQPPPPTPGPVAETATGQFQWWLHSDLRTEATEVAVCRRTEDLPEVAAVPVSACNEGTVRTRETSSPGFSRATLRLLTLQKARRRRACAMATRPKPFPRMEGDRMAYLMSDKYKTEAEALHRKLGFLRQ